MNSLRGQVGVTLIELMVAMVISLLLLAGLVTIFASMRTGFRTTKQLNQLVNQQRLSSTVLADSVASAGYYPATNQQVNGAYPSLGAAFPSMSATNISLGGTQVPIGFAAKGQAIYGTTFASAAGTVNVIAVRMVAINGASPYTCQGGTPSSTVTPPDVMRYIAVFWVQKSKNQLECTLYSQLMDAPANATVGQPAISTAPLVGGQRLPVTGTVYGGVTSMQVMYGVDTNADGSVDAYMKAGTINLAANAAVCPNAIPHSTAGNVSFWPYVRSVRITLNFKSGIDTNRSLTMTRTIDLKNTQALGRSANGSCASSWTNAS